MILVKFMVGTFIVYCGAFICKFQQSCCEWWEEMMNEEGFWESSVFDKVFEYTWPEMDCGTLLYGLAS